MINLVEPSVLKGVYRSDNVSDESTEFAQEPKVLQYNDFRFTPGGQGGNHGPEGQSLGYLENTRGGVLRHTDSRLGPNREGFFILGDKRTGFGGGTDNEFHTSDQQLQTTKQD